MALQAGPDELSALRDETIEALGHAGALAFSLQGQGPPATAVLQLLCSAHISARAQGLKMTVSGADTPAFAQRLALLGFPGGATSFCTTEACPLLGGA